MGVLIPVINAGASAASGLDAAAIVGAIDAMAAGAATVAAPVAVAGGVLSLEDERVGQAPIVSPQDEAAAIKGATALYTPPAIPVGTSSNSEPSISSRTSVNVGAQPQKLTFDNVPTLPLNVPVHFTPTPPPAPQHKTDNPPRRLPLANPTSPPIPYSPQQVAPTTTAQPSLQTIDQSSSDKKYGGLLHSPVTSTAYPVGDYSASIKNYFDQLQKHQKLAGAEFGKWANGLTHNSSIDILDTGLIFNPTPTAPATATPTTTAAPFPINSPEVITPSFGAGIAGDTDLSHQRSRLAISSPVSKVTVHIAPFQLPLNFNIPLPGLVQPGAIPRAVSNVSSKIGAFNPGNVLNNMGGNIKKALGAIDFSKLFAILSFALELHNAALLSTQVVQSCVDIIQNVITAMGLKDWEGNPLEITKMIGDTTENLLKAALGGKNYALISEKWKRYSAVYTAGANIIGSITSIAYGTLQVLEVTGQYVASVGNALKKVGAVSDDAYAWMSEGLSARVARFKNIEHALNGSVQFASKKKEAQDEKDTNPANTAELVREA